MMQTKHKETLKVYNLALEKLATGKSLTEVFDTLTLGAEQIVENAYASILLLDNSGSRLLDGSSPSFTESLKKTFYGMEIGPLAGTCGTAAFTKQVVQVEDVSTDPRWVKFKDFAHTEGLKSCFSAPILGSQGCVYGTFALTFTKMNSPSDFVSEILRSSAHIASIAIEQKRHEENLQLYVKELEDFSVMVSHDLKEPLRHVTAYGDLLKPRIHVSDDKSRHYLERMQAGARRMKNLIYDLLQYSKIEFDENLYEMTDLKVIVENVLEDLDARIKETKGKINLKTLPVIEADPTQMRQLFFNLIGNALKFHRKGTPPVITLDTNCDGDGRFVITVEDNGIGIEEEHIAQIFKPFKRLHSKNDYEGTGIGLTICSRIVARHGGDIRVKRMSKGVTFEVILPEKQN
jgi:signal transduction histidine kinase